MAKPNEFFETKERKEKRRSKKHKDIIYRSYFNIDGTVIRIQNNEDWGSYHPALRKIHERCRHSLSHHCKVFCMRVDFHISNEHWNEGQFSSYLEKVKKKIMKRYKLKFVDHAWGRESSQDGSHHFHLLLLVDGSKVQFPSVIHEMLINDWKKLGHPNPHWSTHHMIRNTVDDDFKDAFEHFSYIAKIHTKDEQPPKARNFGFSSIQ